MIRIIPLWIDAAGRIYTADSTPPDDDSLPLVDMRLGNGFEDDDDHGDVCGDLFE